MPETREPEPLQVLIANERDERLAKITTIVATRSCSRRTRLLQTESNTPPLAHRSRSTGESTATGLSSRLRPQGVGVPGVEKHLN